jgi:RNA polymerase sigma factor for flagellar operon FliA
VNKSSAIKAYKTTSNNRDLDAMVKDNIHLVKKAVYSISKSLPKYIEREDLEQVGYIGLVKAAKSYTGENGAKFSTYAYYRVRGSIYDEIRSADWKPRRAQKRTKEITQSILKLEKEGVFHPSDEQIAKKLDISLEEYYAWIRETAITKVVPMTSFDDDDYLNVADESNIKFENLDIEKIIKETLLILPTQSAQIVSLYYMEELSFKDIAFVMNISQSECSRVFRKSLLILRAHLEKIGYR